MSVSIIVKEHSKNGKSNIIASYYDAKNADIVANIPTIDMLSEYKCKYSNPSKFTLSVDISGSISGMSFQFKNEFEKRESALYATQSFLKMISNLK